MEVGDGRWKKMRESIRTIENVEKIEKIEKIEKHHGEEMMELWNSHPMENPSIS